MPDAGFEASGLSPEEAERLAAAFKPSWELDEAPFVQGGGLDRAQIEALGPEAPGAEARNVGAHMPPQRVETREPEVSVIIDRSITSAEVEASRAPASVRPPPGAPTAVTASPFASPAFTAPAFAPTPQRVAPVMRGRSPDESLELPASLRKSNKGLFIGLGVAVAAAALVLIVHGAASSSSDSTTSSAPVSNGTTTATAAFASSSTTTTASTAAETSQRPSVMPPIPPPPPPIPPAAATVPPAVVAQPIPVPAATPVAALTPPPRNIPVVNPKSLPRVAPPPPVVHHAAPRNPPKPAAGGIVRDNPF